MSEGKLSCHLWVKSAWAAITRLTRKGFIEFSADAPRPSEQVVISTVKPGSNFGDKRCLSFDNLLSKSRIRVAFCFY